MSLLHCSHAAVVSISFNQPHSLKAASSIFSCPVGGQPGPVMAALRLLFSLVLPPLAFVKAVEAF